MSNPFDFSNEPAASPSAPQAKPKSSSQKTEDAAKIFGAFVASVFVLLPLMFFVVVPAVSTIRGTQNHREPAADKPPELDPEILLAFRKHEGIPQLREPYSPGDVGRAGELGLRIVLQGVGYIDLGGMMTQSVRLKGFSTGAGVTGQKVSLHGQVVKVSSDMTGNAVVIEPFDPTPYMRIVEQEHRKTVRIAK